MEDYGLARAELQWLTPPNNEAKEKTDEDCESENRSFVESLLNALNGGY